LYSIYSIRFLKDISEIHTYTYALLKDCLVMPSAHIIKKITEKIGALENHRRNYDLLDILSGELIYSAKIRNIVCSLSAMLDEEYNSDNKEDIEDVPKKLFVSSLDIVHIQSYRDSNEEERDYILKDWGPYINSIGNLMVLEQDKNRSLGNHPYEIKSKLYSSSIFKIVKKQVVNYNEWTLTSCKERNELEVVKILSYLFS
jgi:hypothetical protein